MPIIFNSEGRFGRRSTGLEAQKDPTRCPDGVYSGMTKGLADDGDGFYDVQNMPKDSRNVGALKDENPHYFDTED